jgi:peroxiredoxin
MELEQTLAAFRAEFARTAPAGRVALDEAKIQELLSRFPFDRTIQVGDQAPDFDLPDIDGTPVGLRKALRSGPVVLTFYRGGWCPYCNIQLRAYQAILPQITAFGARLIAISPQLPDGSLSTAEKNQLSFSVLSDVGNLVARRFGIVFSLPPELREALIANNKALPNINGDETWELPVPATFLVATNGTVALAHIDADYRRRLEPDAILDTLNSLSSR